MLWFYGVNTPTIADSSHWTQSWEEMLKIGSCEPGWGSGITPLHLTVMEELEISLTSAHGLKHSTQQIKNNWFKTSFQGIMSSSLNVSWNFYNIDKV